VLEAFSVSHGKASAYLPIIELLKDYFDLIPEDDERRRREKIGGKVTLKVENAFIHGEDAVVLPDGRTSFQALQEAMKAKANGGACLLCSIFPAIN
jgi:hypothetical protein